MNAERRKTMESRGKILGEMDLGKFGKIWNEVTADMGDYKKCLLMNEVTRSVKMAEKAGLLNKSRAVKPKVRPSRARASA